MTRISAEVKDIIRRLLDDQEISLEERALAKEAFPKVNTGRPKRSHLRQHTEEFGRVVARAIAMADDRTAKRPMKTAIGAANSSRKRIQDACKWFEAQTGMTLDDVVRFVRWDRGIYASLQAGGLDALHPNDLLLLAVFTSFNKAMQDAMTAEQWATLQVCHADALAKCFQAIHDATKAEFVEVIAATTIDNQIVNLTSKRDTAIFLEGIAYKAAGVEISRLTRALSGT